MINDYECPRCHNRFPSQNIVMHDRMCTEENPMPLDKSRQLEIKESNNSNNNMQISNSNVNVSQEKPPEEIKRSEISESIPNVQESQLQKSSQSGEFPNVFTCEICHEVLPESEKNDHMYCHDLQNEENNAPNNEDEFRITQSQIDKYLSPANKYISLPFCTMCNRVDIAFACILSGALQQNYTRIALSIEEIKETFNQVEIGDGICDKVFFDQMKATLYIFIVKSYLVFLYKVFFMGFVMVRNIMDEMHVNTGKSFIHMLFVMIKYLT